MKKSSKPEQRDTHGEHIQPKKTQKYLIGDVGDDTSQIKWDTSFKMTDLACVTDL
jgi:hypothetical protein